MIWEDEELEAFEKENAEAYIIHYGVGHEDGGHSGRYPFGSGDDPYQRVDGVPRHTGKHPWGTTDNPYSKQKKFHEIYNELHNQGVTDKQMAEQFNCSINQLKAKRALSSETERQENILRAVRLSRQGLGPTDIAKAMGLPAKKESTVRGWLEQYEKPKKTTYIKTAERLEEVLKKKGGYLDVSKGVDLEMGITNNTLTTSLDILREKGYTVENIRIKQVALPNKFTTTTVLAPKGTSKYDIYKNIGDIHSFEDYSPDGGKTYWAPEYPKAIDRSRVKIVFKEDGGSDADGVCYLRPGVEDLSLGNSSYAQVRIAVKNCDSPKDGISNRYIKGMAVYGDEKDFPPGIDAIFMSSKSKEDGDYKGLKPIKSDTDVDAVFGARIKANGQYHYTDKNGEDQLGSVNKVTEEGDWQKWSKNLASQFLSKQSLELIKTQLDLTYSQALDEFDKISKLSNPVVRQIELEEFASKCESDAVDLQAAALPRQQSHVLLPINSLKPGEIFAPNYDDGEEVVLVRYPYSGPFESPRLIVNNKNKEGINTIGLNSPDAIGIRKEAAEQMSGADYDGDTAIVIPVNRIVQVKTREVLEGLKDFDNKTAYPYVEGMKVMSPSDTQMQMGIVSNLIMDMTLKGASDEEMTRAVKHSMVVIDAEKHKLNYKLSELENDIDGLKRKYQMKPDGTYGGASTLISRASSEAHIREREIARVNDDGTTSKAWTPNEEGEWEYRETGRMIPQRQKNKDGTYKVDDDGNYIYKMVPAMQKTTKMALVEDAHELSSGYPQEELYADYANNMKALAKECRKIAVNMELPKKDPNAYEQYKVEVESLNEKLRIAELNAPRERQAQVIANVAMKEIYENEGFIEKDVLKKLKNTQIQKARAQVGANKKDVQIDISPKEWEAIQANAISPSKLRRILDNSDKDKIKKLASPKTPNSISKSEINLIKSMASAGYSNSDIADRLGMSTATIYKYIKGGE